MKPIARGYTHQAAIFLALCACTVLIIRSQGTPALVANIIYSLSLVGMYSMSALYHVPTWDRKIYLILRRLDHAAIFILIAGTATPICLFGLKGPSGLTLLALFWAFAIIGILISTVWTHGPKWIRASLYISMGWLGIFFFSEIKNSLDIANLWLLVTGGIIYTIGGIIYAAKWPNPFPRVFGYHEIFHIFVIIASGFHFCLNYNIITSLHS